MSGGFQTIGSICNVANYGQDLANWVGARPGGGMAITAGNGIKGSWTELNGSPLNNDVTAIQFTLNSAANTTCGISLDIGIGIGGSQTILIPDLIYGGNGNGQTTSKTPVLPINIPAGTHIWARAQAVNASEFAFVSAHTWDSSFEYGEGCAGVDALTPDLAHMTGTGTATSSATTWTTGPYSVIVASTPRDYVGFFLQIMPVGQTGSQSNNALGDLAIGPTGSEQIIIPSFHFAPNVGNSAYNQIFPHFYPIPLPAGTKISARFGSQNASDTFGFIVYGLYK